MPLRELRRARDITQEELANRSGVDQRNISDIERGKNRNPSWETVAKLSRALDADPFDLFPVGGGAEEAHLPLDSGARA